MKGPPVPQPAVIRRPLVHCPACSATDLQPVVEVDTDEVHFRCGACGRCWHVELGYVHRMHPDTCRGCPEREQCAAVYAADHA